MQNNLSFTEILQESVQFLERNIKNILISYLVIALATTALVFIPQALKSFIASALLIIIIAVIYHADKSQEELSLEKILSLLKSRFLLVLGLSIVLAVIYVIGCILLLVPGIYAMIAFQFATWILIFKPETKFFDTISYSHKLTKGRMWKIFVLNLLAGLSILIVFGITSFVFSIALGILGMGSSIVASVNYILTLIISVLATIFQLFLYLRVEASYQPEA